MRTILYLIPHLEKSGPVTQLFGLINHLDSTQYSAVVLTLFKERKNSMLTLFEERGIKVIRGNLERWQLYSQTRLLKRIIKIENPDIIHSCSVLTDSICLGHKIAKPIVLTLHCYIYEDLIARYGFLLGKIMCKREEKAIRAATVVVTVSHTLAKKYKNAIDRTYIPINNGIETSLWEIDKDSSKTSIREKLHLSLNSYIILSTNLLDSIKDPILLIQAFKDANIPNSMLIMLGNGKLQTECIKHKTESIIFPGRINNVKDYLYASDVFVSASKSEGMPYAVLEAKCTGISMILSDIPQHKEVTCNDGDIKYFQVGNKAELIEALRCQKSKRQKYNMENFTASFMSNAYQKIYASIDINSECKKREMI